MSQGSSDSVYSSLLCRECMLSPVPVGCHCTAPVSPELEQSRCNPRTLAENRPPRSQERLRHPPWARGRQFKCLTRRLKLPQEKGAGTTTRTAARAPGDARLHLHNDSMWGAASAGSSPGEQPPAFGGSLVNRQGARGGPGMTAAHGALKARSGKVDYAHYAQEPPHAGACRSSQTRGKRPRPARCPARRPLRLALASALRRRLFVDASGKPGARWASRPSEVPWHLRTQACFL